MKYETHLLTHVVTLHSFASELKLCPSCGEVICSHQPFEQMVSLNELNNSGYVLLHDVRLFCYYYRGR